MFYINCIIIVILYIPRHVVSVNEYIILYYFITTVLYCW